jgi:S-formylglutathione hydrolase FrmB
LRQLGAQAVMTVLAACAAAQGPAGQVIAAPPPDANSPAARAAWKQLAGTDDPAARDKLLPAALDAIGRDPNDVRRLIAADDAYDPIGPGRAERTVQVADAAKKYDVSFTVAAPAGYRSGKPWPVLLAAHGQHGDGRSFVRTALRLLGADADKYIIVAPTMPGPREYSGKSYQEQAYLQPLAWVKRHMNVDDDRVCLAGYSMGGHTAWHLATMFPRQFAAAVAMAGVPWFQGAPHTANMYLENLSPLAFWSIWGELDRPAPPAIGQVQFNRAAAARLNDLNNDNFRATELPGVGHEGCYPNPRDFAAFLARAKRQPMPAKFSHTFHLQDHTRGYYLEAVALAAQPMRMDQRITVSFDHKPTPEESDRKMEDYFRRFLFSFSADLDRQANSMTITLNRIRTIRLYVMDGMFDLARPVSLRVGARTWKGLVPTSAQCMLKHYADDRDASAVIVNEVDIDSTGRTVIRYK